MFKRVFQSLSKSFSHKEEAPPVAPVSKGAPAPEKAGSLLEKLGTPSAPAEKKKVPIAPVPTLSPEELCGITPSMTKDQIRAQLSLLYRRHNRSSSSLDAKMRAEAEKMLAAIVTVREKHFGPI